MRKIKISRGIGKRLERMGITTVEVREYAKHSGIVIDVRRDDADMAILSQFGGHSRGKTLKMNPDAWGDKDCYRIGGSPDVYPQIMAI
jgi:hypothetical protein